MAATKMIKSALSTDYYSALYHCAGAQGGLGLTAEPTGRQSGP